MQRVRMLSLATFLALAAALGSHSAHAQETVPPAAPSRPSAEADATSEAAATRPQDAPSSAATSQPAGAPDELSPRPTLSDAFGARAPRPDGSSASSTEIFYGDPNARFGNQGQQQPAAQQTYTPLTSGQKMRRAFKKAFISPEGYARTAISATITEWGEDDLPHKDTEDRVADGLSRFAIKFGTRATRTVFGSGIYPVLFKQDPRYERSEKKNIGARALHAVSRVFVTRGDNGKLQPNYSRWAGSLTSSALSNIWEQSTPGHDRIGVDATFRRFGTNFISDAWQTVVFSEFLPDIIRIFKRK